ncbi:PAAR domain-containing protein [Pantoea sp. EA-12]|uniref:PAAR domain-containing protein n=1 Tax=Pantoea sp. EA-12 TaxID=3043303 RepID=UPI0024B5F5B6|nr:PAAR domain-containing protein [Pantoea sp. EA-12]MDI9219331.1 PAAR domain-containing protein [Pantoea sp. EA-12]
MRLQCIWTGDTTTHGGTLLEGSSIFTYAYKNKAVCVGHKFWCPKCYCWSTFLEGYNGFTIEGKARVLNGYRASCGAVALHQLGIQEWCEDECSPSTKRTYQDDLKEVKSNQSQNGAFFHNFKIVNHSSEPVKYIVFSGETALDLGNINTKDGYMNSHVSKIRTDDSYEIQLAVQAPRLKIK